MSLATRCTACGTAFRVVQDQLKVSEGWVRCGQCREVFSAFEQLFDLERDDASVRLAPAREPAPVAGEQVDDGVPAPAGHDPGDGRLAHPVAASAEPRSAGRVQGDVASAGAEAATGVGDTENPRREATPEPGVRAAARSGDVRPTPDRDDAGPPTIYAALDEPSPMEAQADASLDELGPGEPATRDAHALEEARDATEPALLAPELDAPDDDESPLLPPLQSETRAEPAQDAPFLAPELDTGVDADDTIRLPAAPSGSPPTAAPRDPDVAVDEWAAEAAHERPSLTETEIDAHLFGKRRHARRHAPPVHVSARDQLDFSDARFDSNLLTDDETLEGDVPPSERGELPLESAPPPATPEFLRRAERQARWQRPATRVALAAASILLAGLLALQATHHFRDELAARWPALRPALLAWCGAASCVLEAPRRIDDITVENTALARASGDAFRLAVTLRNHAKVPVALPAVDLSLTDVSGRLVARRALSARDFKVSPAVLPPNGDVALEAPIAAHNARVSGYTVEIFYP